jgi:aldose 1-epimerase
VRLDANGLPIHGLLTASSYWELESRIACAERAAVSARLDFGADEELLAAFPFPHELRVEAELALDTLTVATTLSPGATSEFPSPSVGTPICTCRACLARSGPSSCR